MLFYNIRPSAGPATPLSGARVEEDLPTQAVDDALLGQIDGVEGGEITGWACKRGYMGAPLQARAQAQGTQIRQFLWAARSRARSASALSWARPCTRATG